MEFVGQNSREDGVTKEKELREPPESSVYPNGVKLHENTNTVRRNMKDIYIYIFLISRDGINIKLNTAKEKIIELETSKRNQPKESSEKKKKRLLQMNRVSVICGTMSSDLT